MGEFNTVGLEDIIDAFSRREAATVEAVPKMLKAGADVLIDRNSGREYSTESNRNSAEAGKRTGRNRRAACNVYTTGYTGAITAFNERRTGLA